MTTKNDNWFKISLLVMFLIFTGTMVYLLTDIDIVVKNIINPLDQQQWDNPAQSTDTPIQCEFIIEDGREKICIGEEGLSKAEGSPNTDCRIGFRYTGLDSPPTEWKYYDDITLDNNGEAQIVDTPGYPGVYEFKMICVSQNDFCSAGDSIEVVPCDEEGNEISYDDYVCNDVCIDHGGLSGEAYDDGDICGFTTTNPDCCCEVEGENL